MDQAAFHMHLDNCLQMQILMILRVSTLSLAATTATTLSTPRHNRLAQAYLWPPSTHRSPHSRHLDHTTAALRSERRLTWLIQVISPQCLLRTAVRMAWPGKAPITLCPPTTALPREHRRIYPCNRRNTCRSNPPCLSTAGPMDRHRMAKCTAICLHMVTRLHCRKSPLRGYKWHIEVTKERRLQTARNADSTLGSGANGMDYSISGRYGKNE